MIIKPIAGRETVTKAVLGHETANRNVFLGQETVYLRISFGEMLNNQARPCTDTFVF